MNERQPNLLDRFLGLFSEVRAGEGARVVLLLVNILLLLTAYYVIKTVREPMILADGSAELKSWAAAGQALVLLGFVPLYGWISSKLPRKVLIVVVTAFFLACLQGFYLPAVNAVQVSEALEAGDDAGELSVESALLVVEALAETLPPVAEIAVDTEAAQEAPEVEASVGPVFSDFFRLGFIFYVWVGIFSLALIAQFWSFANDLYSREEGDRLFPIIGIGATLGAVIGSGVTGQLFALGVETPMMLQIASLLLLLHGISLFFLSGQADEKQNVGSDKATSDEGLSGDGGFKLVLTRPYLRLIAIVILLLNIVNSTGEYILGRMVKENGERLLAAGEIESLGGYIGAFYGDYFLYVNIATVLIQAFVVSRIVKHIGMKGVLFALPIIAFGAYGLLAAGLGLVGYRWAKTAENTTDYSVMNTAKALIWLPTTRAEKYKAKQAIDTFVVRVGDVCSLGFVLVGTQAFTWGLRDFALANLVLVVLWLGATFLLYKRYQSLTAEEV
ncbi:MAG: AAA family ATP:ADP antiporter [Bradymonadia bacterium]